MERLVCVVDKVEDGEVRKIVVKGNDLLDCLGKLVVKGLDIDEDWYEEVKCQLGEMDDEELFENLVEEIKMSYLDSLLVCSLKDSRGNEYGDGYYSEEVID